MWLQVTTQPDISYIVTLLSRFAHNPGKLHWSAVKHVLAYIKGTLDYRITYSTDGELSPIGYINSNFARYKDIHCSTEGNIFIVAKGPVSWESKRQETVTLSMVEAKYMGFLRVAIQALCQGMELGGTEVEGSRIGTTLRSGVRYNVGGDSTLR